MRPANAKLFWTVTYFLVALFCTVCMLIAPGKKWWLHEDISTFGADVDHLFNVILAITGVTFVLVQVILLYVLWRFAETDQPRKAMFVHGNHQLEVIWTIIPAGLLVFIALYQMNTWIRIKFPSNFPPELREQIKEKRPFAEVLAGQFEWRITYPGGDQKLGTRDDVHVLNNLHVIRGKPVLIHLRSRDVLHSFFLPNFRLKQDAVPGMTIPVWFEAKQDTKPGYYDLMCAELCGWGHYKMKGELFIHENEADFKAWLDKAKLAEEAAE